MLIGEKLGVHLNGSTFNMGLCVEQLAEASLLKFSLPPMFLLPPLQSSIYASEPKF
jgi:hypothetical protein